jgi:hypothetical protein
MTDALIQAKATIAAALIQSKAVDINGVVFWDKPLNDLPALQKLKQAVNRIYAEITESAQ